MGGEMATCDYCHNSQDGTDSYEMYDGRAWTPICAYCHALLTARRQKYGSRAREMAATGFASPTARGRS
jgi:hypothetical protein